MKGGDSIKYFAMHGLEKFKECKSVAEAQKAIVLYLLSLYNRRKTNKMYKYFYVRFMANRNIFLGENEKDEAEMILSFIADSPEVAKQKLNQWALESDVTITYSYLQ